MTKLRRHWDNVRITCRNRDALSRNGSKMKSEKTIIFDLSEVIIRGIIGIEYPLESILQTDTSCIIPKFGGENLRNICTGNISEEEYFDNIITTNDWNLSIGELKQITRNNFDIKISGMPQFVCDLARNNSLVLYSDHAKEWISYILNKHNFLDVFSHKVFSYEQNCLKSDDSAFPNLLKRLELKNSNVIFIDDNYVNVKNAESAGIYSFLFRDQLELKNALSVYGIDTQEHAGENKVKAHFTIAKD